jgi:hypothetical protein
MYRWLAFGLKPGALLLTTLVIVIFFLPEFPRTGSGQTAFKSESRS